MFRKNKKKRDQQKRRESASSRGGEGGGWLPKAVVTRLRRRSTSTKKAASDSPCSVVHQQAPPLSSVELGGGGGGGGGEPPLSSPASFEQSSSGDDSWTNVTTGESWEIVSPRTNHQEPSGVADYVKEIGNKISGTQNNKVTISSAYHIPNNKGDDCGSSPDSGTEDSAIDGLKNDCDDYGTNATDDDDNDSHDGIIVPAPQEELPVAVADVVSSRGNETNNMLLIDSASNSSDDEVDGCGSSIANKPVNDELHESAPENRTTNNNDDCGSSLAEQDISASELIEEGDTGSDIAAQQMELSKDLTQFEQGCSSGCANETNSSFNRYIAFVEPIRPEQAKDPMIEDEANEAQNCMDENEGSAPTNVQRENAPHPVACPFDASEAKTNDVDDKLHHDKPATATTTSNAIEIGQRVCIRSKADNGRVGTIVSVVKKGTYSVQLDVDARVVDKLATSLEILSSPAHAADAMLDMKSGERSHPVPPTVKEKFKVGQRVVITKTNLAGQTGVILKKIDKVTYKIQIDGGGTTNKRSTSLRSVLPDDSNSVSNESNPLEATETATFNTTILTRKRFAVGTSVRIVSGTSRGATGLIVGWKGIQTYSVEIAGSGTLDKRAGRSELFSKNKIFASIHWLCCNLLTVL